MRASLGFLRPLCLKLLNHDPGTSDTNLRECVADIRTSLVSRALDIFRVAIVNVCVGMVSIIALYIPSPPSPIVVITLYTVYYETAQNPLSFIPRCRRRIATAWDLRHSY